MMRVIIPAMTFFGIAVGVCAALAIGLALVAVYQYGRRG